jgi:hypothetical protein
MIKSGHAFAKEHNTEFDFKREDLTKIKEKYEIKKVFKL